MFPNTCILPLPLILSLTHTHTHTHTHAHMQIDGVSNVDFSLTDSELIFQRGTSRACVDVTIVDDTTVENDETLSVVLRRADNDRVTFSPDTTATITITDNGDST